MSNVRLQRRPARIQARCAAPSPPFQFSLVSGVDRVHPQPTSSLPVAVACVLARTIDAVMVFVGLTLFIAVHVVVWSYAFDIGPAASCAGLPCPPSLRTWALAAAGGLGIVAYLAAQVLRRRRHHATAFMMLVLVAFNLAATMYVVL